MSWPQNPDPYLCGRQTLGQHIIWNKSTFRLTPAFHWVGGMLGKRQDFWPASHLWGFTHPAFHLGVFPANLAFSSPTLSHLPEMLEGRVDYSFTALDLLLMAVYLGLQEMNCQKEGEWISSRPLQLLDCTKARAKPLFNIWMRRQLCYQPSLLPPPDFSIYREQRAKSTHHFIPYLLKANRELPLNKSPSKGPFRSQRRRRKKELAKKLNIYHHPQASAFSTCPGCMCQNWIFSSQMSLLVVKLHFLGPFQSPFLIFWFSFNQENKTRLC